jgi:ankyrin repeat protein
MADRIAALWRYAYEEGATLDLLQELLQLDPAQAGARRYDVTLLHMAANHRLHEGVALLLANGAEVNAVDDRGETPLHRAAWNLDPEGCLQLLDAGADPTVRDRHGRTPFRVAVNGDVWAPREDWEQTQRLLERAEAEWVARQAEPGAAADGGGR